MCYPGLESGEAGAGGRVSFLMPRLTVTGLVFLRPWLGGLGRQEWKSVPGLLAAVFCTAWYCHPFLGSLSSDGISLPAFSRPSSPWRTFLPLLSVFSFLTLWTRGFSLLTPTPDFTSGPALFLGVSQHQDSRVPRGHRSQDRKTASPGLGVCEIF